MPAAYSTLNDLVNLQRTGLRVYVHGVAQAGQELAWFRL